MIHEKSSDTSKTIRVDSQESINISATLTRQSVYSNCWDLSTLNDVMDYLNIKTLLLLKSHYLCSIKVCVHFTKPLWPYCHHLLTKILKEGKEVIEHPSLFSNCMIRRTMHGCCIYLEWVFLKRFERRLLLHIQIPNMFKRLLYNVAHQASPMTDELCGNHFGICCIGSCWRTCLILHSLACWKRWSLSNRNTSTIFSNTEE